MTAYGYNGIEVRSCGGNTDPFCGPGGIPRGMGLVFLIPLLLVISLAGSSGCNAAGDTPTIYLAPEETQFLWQWDLAAIRQHDDLDNHLGAEGLGSNFLDLEKGAGKLGVLDLDLADVEEYVWVDQGSASEMFIVRGQLQLDDLRADLEEQGLQEGSYRDYEVWEGPTNYAFLGKEGGDIHVVSSHSLDALEGMLQNLYRESGSLADSEDGDLRRLLERLQGGSVLFAAVGNACPLRRCGGFGVSFTSLDEDRRKLQADVALLYSSASSADDAADEYDQVADLMQSAVGLDLLDTRSEGEFVTGDATLLVSRPAVAAEPVDREQPAAAPARRAPPVAVGSDRDVLVALYRNAGGEGWLFQQNWLSDLPIGQWQGVLADGEGRVTQLRIGADTGEPLMSGALPPELGSLSNLEVLILHGELYGDIPPELGNLSNLKQLNLSDNSLTGEVPPELGQLKELARLDLRNNKLAGPLPEELTSLPMLRLAFGNNVGGLCVPASVAAQEGAFSSRLDGPTCSGQ